MKHGLKKFKNKRGKAVTLRNTEAQGACPANVPKRKARRVNKEMGSSGQEKSTRENLTNACHISDSIAINIHAHINN